MVRNDQSNSRFGARCANVCVVSAQEGGTTHVVRSNYGSWVRSFDVVVVGGGPAGACAATLLARGGQSVLVVDKASFPRDKCCGDGLTAGALRQLDRLGLDPGTIPSWQWVDDVRLSTPRGTVREFSDRKSVV